MRWPFFFRRDSAAKGSSAPRERAPINDWASIPPIQRTVPQAQLTAATAEFIESLAGTHDPDISLAPLGHEVRLDAPSGIVTGLTRHVETYAASGELVARPRPRRDAAVQRRTFGAEESGPSQPVADGAEFEPAEEPVMTRFAVIDEPVRAHVPMTHLTGHEAHEVLQHAMPRPAQATPVAAAGEPPGHDTAPDAAAPAPLAQRLTLGQSRRLGLGAPLSPQHAASIQRSADAPSTFDRVTRARTPQVIPSESAPEPEPKTSIANEIEAGASSFDRLVPIAHLPVQRVVEAQEASAERGLAAGSEPGATPGVIQRVAVRPLPPTNSQRVPAQAPVISARPPLVTVRSPADLAATYEATGAAPIVQRWSAVDPGGLPAASPQAGITPRAAPASTSQESGPGISAWSLPGIAPLGPPIQRSTPAAQDFFAISPFATAAAPVGVQRATAFSAAPFVQRQAAAGEGPPEEPIASAPPAATAPAPGSDAGMAPAQSDKDLDELARKLHDRISLHLRRDLLVQRERAGMVVEL